MVLNSHRFICSEGRECNGLSQTRESHFSLPYNTSVFAPLYLTTSSSNVSTRMNKEGRLRFNSFLNK